MSEPSAAGGPRVEDAPDEDDVPGAARPPWTSWPTAARRWVLAGTFAGGLVVGILLTGVLADSSPVYAEESAAAVGDVAGGLGTLDPDAEQAVVNQACLRALNVAQDALAAGAALGEAAAVLDPAQLDEAVRRLQPLQSRLDVDLADCRVVEVEGPGRADSSPGGTPGPATATPTD